MLPQGISTILIATYTLATNEWTTSYPVNGVNRRRFLLVGSLFSDNSRVYYKPHSLAAGGVRIMRAT